MAKQLKIRQVRSTIDSKEPHKPEIRGMVRAVRHLIEVEEIG